jgi:hypothetical protein
MLGHLLAVRNAVGVFAGKDDVGVDVVPVLPYPAADFAFQGYPPVRKIYRGWQAQKSL